MLSLPQRERRQAWVLLAPMLVMMFLLTAWPLARTLWLSFTDAGLIGDGTAPAWVGTDNFVYALTDRGFSCRAVANALFHLCLGISAKA